MTERTPQQPPPTNLFLWVIWGALTSAVLMYFVIMQVVGVEADPGNPPNDLLVKILTGIGLVSAIAAFMVRKKVTLPLARESTPENLSKVLASCIISWALAESIAIYGLVLGMLGAPMMTCGIFFVGGFGAMVFLSPNFAPLKSKTEE